MSTAINYLSDYSGPDEEEQALGDLCAYLVYKGKYKDVDAARQDASERVAFLEKADFFADNPRFADASVARKSTEALIQGHSLRQLLADNAGFLPEYETEAKPAPASEHKRSITDVFGAIELDMRTGLSQEQIVHKLEDSGISRDNAEDAVAVVVRQRRQKRQTRFIAAATILVLSLILFVFAR